MGKKRNRLIIMSNLIDLNTYIAADKSSRYKGGSIKKANTQNVYLECLSQRKAIDINKCGLYDIRLYWITPDNKKDADNIYFCKKSLLDGFESSGLINSDGRKNVRHISDYIRTIKGKSFVIVRFHEVKTTKT